MNDNKNNKEPLNKNNRVPKLRFENYNDCYKKYSFSYLYNIYNGLNKDKESFGFGYPIVNYMDVNKNIFITKDIVCGLVNTSEIEQERFNITTKDVLITRTSETKQEIAYASCLLEEIDKCVYSGFLLKASPKYDITYAPYITLLMHSPKYRKSLMKLATETSRALINSDNLSKIDVIIPNIEEQKKVFSFFRLLEKKISILNQEVDILKKYKKGLENYSHKYVKKYGTALLFRDLFTPINERNNLSLKQYTVGKYGIKEMDEGKYDISNHKIFNPTNLIVGIGIEEIGISENTNGSVSPIYDVFKINNDSYYDSVRITLKSQLWSNRNFITKKSTRREYEVDKKELLKMKIYVCKSQEFNNITMLIDSNKKTIELLEQKLNSLIVFKKYLLNNMFI